MNADQAVQRAAELNTIVEQARHTYEVALAWSVLEKVEACYHAASS